MAQSLSADTYRLEQLPGQAERGTVEIHGVQAGAFTPAIWQADTLHFLPDARSPLLTPRWAGTFRNIYAPSITEEPDGWRVFYGAWDGVPTGNDRLYSIRTRDFLDFSDRRTEIEHGVFQHVCNVSAIRLADGGYRIVGTAYPDERGRNKPAVFVSSDGKRWNGTPAPYAATRDDLIDIQGHEPFADADINGVNVLFRDQERWNLYFSNFRQWGHVHRAVSDDGKHFEYEGVALNSTHMVNDVKCLTVGNTRWYLMGLHQNGNRLWYTLSQDPAAFPHEQLLASNQGNADPFMVAIGWVVREQSVLGFLYGAGAINSLDRNRLFARWLQKRLVFKADSGSTEPQTALGPDRAVLDLAGQDHLTADLQILAEDGKTLLHTIHKAQVTSGAVYRLIPDAPASQTSP